MTPYEQAKQVYNIEHCARTFYEDLLLHINGGYVISTPDLFLMGRPVDRYDDIERIRNPAVTYDSPNCWWVYLAAGNLANFFRHEPYRLPFFGWERNNVARFYTRQALFRGRRRSQPDCKSVSSGSTDRLRPREQGWWFTQTASTASAASTYLRC